jgi:hypothetical protein
LLDMQELRPVGLDADGSAVVCEGAAGKFRILINETLRKAVSGELKAELHTAQSGAELSPREIQARIRAGATVVEVSELTGAPADRIARFAGPVLLERSRAAEMAKLAHPVRGDGPMHISLAVLMAEALAERGHPEQTEWDAFKGLDNRWMVRISWTVGRTENSARFAFTPGGGGGTATPADDTARELLDPDARRALRSVAGPAPVPHYADDGDDADPAESAAEPRTPARLRPTINAVNTHGAGRPGVPSWEDVLLGVRGHGNS